MQYLLLLYSAEDTKPTGDDVDLQPWIDYSEALAKSGAMLGGEALQPSSTGTVVSLVGGTESITDGPYAETKEQLGGYYLIECDSLDEALEWAKKCPAAHFGKVEVRPIQKYDI